MPSYKKIWQSFLHRLLFFRLRSAINSICATDVVGSIVATFVHDERSRATILYRPNSDLIFFDHFSTPDRVVVQIKVNGICCFLISATLIGSVRSKTIFSNWKRSFKLLWVVDFLFTLMWMLVGIVGMTCFKTPVVWRCACWFESQAEAHLIFGSYGLAFFSWYHRCVRFSWMAKYYFFSCRVRGSFFFDSNL